METLLQDLRDGFRVLRKDPGFTAVAVMTLALGIGANTAIFSVVNAALFRPLPLRQPGQIVRLQEYHQRPANVTGATFRDVRERNRVFSHVAAYRIFSQNLSDTRQAVPPEQIDTAFVTQDFLPLLGVAPFLGSGFGQEEFRENAEQVVILDYGLWQHHFGSARDIVGRLITLHGTPHRVAGVMPMGFSFPESVQAWAPLTDNMAFPQNRRAHLFTTLAREKAGISREAVNADLQTIAAQVQQENHDVDPEFTFRAERLQDNLVSSVRPTLLILLGGGCLRALDCMRECRQPFALAVGRTSKGNRGAFRFRGHAVTPGKATLHRERVTRAHRRNDWMPSRAVAGEGHRCRISRGHPWFDGSGDQLASPALCICGFIAGVDTVWKYSRNAILWTAFAGAACRGWPKHGLGTPPALSFVPGDLGSGARYDLACSGRPAHSKLHSVAAS